MVTEPTSDADWHHGLGPYLSVEHREHCLGCQALDRWRTNHPQVTGDRACYEFRDDWLDALRSLTRLFTRGELETLTSDTPLDLLRLVAAVRAKFGDATVSATPEVIEIEPGTEPGSEVSD